MYECDCIVGEIYCNRNPTYSMAIIEGVNSVSIMYYCDKHLDIMRKRAVYNGAVFKIRMLPSIIRNPIP